MNIFINNKSVGIAGGKIKKMLGAAALIICCIMPLTISASAANNEVKLETNGSEASLELYFPQAAAEEIASMQVSVYVAANSDSVDLEFIPDSGLASKIVESRYQSDTGTLNIYLAGTEALFSSYGFTKVGMIKISTSGSSAASAEVEVVKDSVKFVRSGELVSPDGDTDYPAAVNITAAGQSSSGTAEPSYPSSPSYPSYPSYPNYPTGNYFPSISLSTDVENNRNKNDNEPVRNDNDNRYDVDDDDDSYDDFILEEQDTAGENFNPPDTSSLLDALSRADDYKEKDYSESSYDELKDAVNKAEKLVSDPNATQEDIDDALLNIENAVGMLKYKNDIPSGAEGYGGNNNAGMNVGVNNNGIFGENIDYDSGDNGYGQGDQSSNHGGNGGGAQAAQNGDIVNASNGAQSVDSDPFSGTENRGKNLVLWIVVIAAIVVIASVTAIIFLKKANGKKENVKKSDAGNHFKN